MRRLLLFSGMVCAFLAVAAPAMAAGDSAPSGPAVAVEGSLDGTGWSFAATIAYNEEDDISGGNPAPPPTFVWRYGPFATTAIDPVNNVLYCPPGQYHLYAWRELNPLGAAIWGLPEGTIIPFWLTEFLTGVRIPGTENIPIAGGLDSNDRWYVHVCVGPSTPSVEDAIDGLIPEPLVTLNPRPGFGGITGFETWGWYEQDSAFGPDPDFIVDDLSIRDPRWGLLYGVVAHLWAYEFVWDFGDGTAPLVVTRPGGSDTLPLSAAVTHTYETKGTWPVTLTVTWTGDYTYTGYTGTEVVGPTDRIGIADYPVQEVVTRTVPNP